MEENGVRYKIKAADGNEIDTMFVDNRIKGGNGETLVICSEGNAGFYEIGIMSTPMQLNYSTLVLLLLFELCIFNKYMNLGMES